MCSSGLHPCLRRLRSIRPSVTVQVRATVVGFADVPRGGPKFWHEGTEGRPRCGQASIGRCAVWVVTCPSPSKSSHWVRSVGKASAPWATNQFASASDQPSKSWSGQPRRSFDENPFASGNRPGERRLLHRRSRPDHGRTTGWGPLGKHRHLGRLGCRPRRRRQRLPTDRIVWEGVSICAVGLVTVAVAVTVGPLRGVVGKASPPGRSVLSP